MFSFIFNIEHEWYCYTFRPETLSIKDMLIFQFKLFINIFGISLMITAPIAILLLVEQHLLN